jgi:hypothetical protein
MSVCGRQGADLARRPTVAGDQIKRLYESKAGSALNAFH